MSKLPVQKSVNSPKIDLDPESGRTEAPDRTGPPRISHWLLCKMAHYETSHRCAGDFVEEYRRIVRQEGDTKARHWYRSQVLKSIPPYLAYLFTWKMSMLYNYLKIALRNMQKHKAYSIINLLSLTLGMSCCLLIYIWVQDEFQYDRFQANRQRIAQVYSVTRYSDGRESVFMGSYYPLARILSDDVPGIVTASRLQVANELFVRRGERKFVDNVVGLADPSFFRIFTFRWIQGDPETAFSDRASVVITEEMVRRYFGNEDPMGETLNFLNRFDLTVTGVISDCPSHSSVGFDCVIPFVWMFGGDGEEPRHWGGNPLSTVALLHPDGSFEEIQQTISNIVEERQAWPSGMEVDFRLHPMQKWHLFPPEGGGLFQSVVIFSMIALAVLVIACINFINLSTARSTLRAGEIGLRKVVGARRSDLVKQFFGESVFLTLFALVISLGFVSFFLPTFNGLLNKQLSLSLLVQPSVILGLLGITLFTGILSGSYPALYLSAFEPATVIRRSYHRGSGGSAIRRILVVIQFSLSVLLIIGLMVITRQNHFMMTEDLGLDKEHLVSILMTSGVQQQYSAVKTELLQDTNILNVSKSFQHPSNISSTVTALDWSGKDPGEKIPFHWDYIGYEYFETMGLEILDGRAFSKTFPTDVKEAYIVNQEAVRLMGLESPVGERLSVFREEGRIIGVVKDFHFQPFYASIQPFVFILRPQNPDLLLVRMRPGGTSAALQTIERVYKQFESDYPFRFRFFNDYLRRNIYSIEHRIGRIAGWFTLLAVLIACLGLFGLASFVTERRNKEIGIRKVMGASAMGVIFMLCKAFIKWVLIANLLAWPTAYFLMQKHLQRYAYRIDLGLDVFLVSGTAAVLIAVLTVSSQAFRAARKNPVDTLRYE